MGVSTGGYTDFGYGFGGSVNGGLTFGTTPFMPTNQYNPGGTLFPVGNPSGSVPSTR